MIHVTYDIVSNPQLGQLLSVFMNSLSVKNVYNMLHKIRLDMQNYKYTQIMNLPTSANIMETLSDVGQSFLQCVQALE